MTTNTASLIMTTINDDDDIIAMSRDFYREGGFDEVTIAEMAFSCAALQGKI
jgi:hypothetical protein